MDEIEEQPTEQAYIEKVSKHYQRHWRGTIAMLFCSLGVSFLPLMIAVYLYNVYNLSTTWLLCTALFTLFTCVPLVTLPRRTLYKKRRDFETLLEEGTEDSVGALLEGALVWRELSIEAYRFQEKLILLLPHLTPEQGTVSLTPSHRQILRNMLSGMSSYFGRVSVFTKTLLNSKSVEVRMERNLRFAMALLQAVSHIGTPEDVPVVESLLKLTPNNRYIVELQAAARECLPLLQERIAALKDQNSLLRASAPNIDEATLLRPSQSTAEPQEELLRSSSTEPVIPIRSEVQDAEEVEIRLQG